MKALVTGATGFVGGALVLRLLDEGWKVNVLVRRGSDSSKIGRGARKFVGDLSDWKVLKKAISGVDVVFNCAAALPHHKLLDEEYEEANISGLGNLLDVAGSERVGRVIHVSTVGVYGPTSRRGASERTKVKTSDIYTRTKHEGDELVKKYINEGGKAVIIRPTIAYGPGDVRPVFLKLFRMVKMGVNMLIGGGENYLHTIYIDNLLDGMMLAARRRKALGEDFIIGDKQCPKMKEIMDYIVTASERNVLRTSVPGFVAKVGGALLGMERTARFVTEDRKYSIKKAERLLGYKPKVSLEEGMKNTHTWYRKEGLI